MLLSKRNRDLDATKLGLSTAKPKAPRLSADWILMAGNRPIRRSSVHQNLNIFDFRITEFV